MADGDWYFKIVPDQDGAPAGTIGIWAASWRGEPIHETGWMFLPAFRGRGISTAAPLILSRESDARFERIHAFRPPKRALNALCRRFGFRLTEETGFDYRDTRLRMNVWELAVS